jgi:hypothetical protein
LNQNILISGGWDNTVKIWDLREGKEGRRRGGGERGVEEEMRVEERRRRGGERGGEEMRGEEREGKERRREEMRVEEREGKEGRREGGEERGDETRVAEEGR